MGKLREAYWNPVLPLCLLVYFAGRSYSAGLSNFRLFALLTMFVWLALSIYDRASNGKFTRWLYSDDE